MLSLRGSQASSGRNKWVSSHMGAYCFLSSSSSRELGHSQCHVGESCRGNVKVWKKSSLGEVFREVVFEVGLKNGVRFC